MGGARVGRRGQVLTRRRAPQHGHTPLHTAARTNHLAMVELLVAKGADKEAPDVVRGGRADDVECTQSALDSCRELYLGF